MLKDVIQQTQKHMYDQLQQSLQQTYSGLTLGMPLRAQEHVAQFTKTDEAVILTKNLTKNRQTPSYEDWNSDDWDESFPPVDNNSNDNVSENTQLKAVACQSATAPATSTVFGGARRKTGFPTAPNHPHVRQSQGDQLGLSIWRTISTREL